MSNGQTGTNWTLQVFLVAAGWAETWLLDELLGQDHSTELTVGTRGAEGQDTGMSPTPALPGEEIPCIKPRDSRCQKLLRCSS